MTKRVPYFYIVAALVLSIVAASLSARTSYDNRDRVASKQSNTITQYSFPTEGRQPVAAVRATEEEENNLASGGITVRQSLGTPGVASSPASPGLTIKTTYEDWHYSQKGRKIDFRGTPDIHFVYSSMTTNTPATDIYGYNVYDPAAGVWPQGFGTGCVVQATDGSERGLWPNMAVGPQGFVVMYGSDNAGQPLDNRIYYQTAQHDCFWGAGNKIPPSKYKTNFSLTPTGQVANHPQIEVQIVGSDTVTHALVHSNAFVNFPGNNGLTEVVIQYFRKVSWANGDTNSWVGPITIDSAGYRAFLTSSKTGTKVAVIYPEYTALAFANAQGGDQNIVYRESIDGGLNFGPVTNITNYNRAVASYAPWIETHGLYDTNGDLHIIWNANPWPADVYNVAGFFFGDFSGSLFHWSQASGGVISRIKNADWGLPFNTQVCGFGGSNMLYIGQFSISECDGNMYVIWSQVHDIKNTDVADTVNNIFDDCASSNGAQGSRVFKANAEIFLSVSSTLSGLLWDAPRNLTKSYTPGCDSATGGGVCQHDLKATMSRYGQNVAGLTWPGGEKVDPSPLANYAGNFYLHMMYMNDHYPGSVVNTTPVITNNDLKWVRLACVDPITASQISAAPLTVGYPEYQKHGTSRTVPVTVTNDGNATLNVTTIGKVQTSGPAGWLQTSAVSLTIPAGVGNTGTFNVVVNSGGVVNTPGTVVSLNGYVYMLSNAVNNDSLAFVVDNFIIADTIVGVKWDTVRTDNGNVASATGRIGLTVGSHGNMGRGGLGRVNLDYAANGIGVECDTLKDVYLYDGGPLLIRRDSPVVYSFTSSAFQGTFATDVSFKPVNVIGKSAASLSTVKYDGFYSGVMVSEDSTVALERTYYAPKGGGDSSDFIIICSKFYSYDGLAHNNLLIGDLIDWDLPADVGATNKTGIEGSTVFIRGTDTGATAACPARPNKTRFAANTFLGMHTRAEKLANACANDVGRYGQYAGRNDSDVFTADNGVLDPAKTWTKAGALSGAAALAPSLDSTDVHIVTTYKYNYNLAGNDTVTVYTALTTELDGTSADLKANFTAACNWYNNNLRPGCTVCSCCIGSTGNADGSLDDVVDIGDLTALIDNLFITLAPLLCTAEGDIASPPDAVVDIGDLTALIDHLFINLTPTAPCQ